MCALEKCKSRVLENIENLKICCKEELKTFIDEYFDAVCKVECAFSGCDLITKHTIKELHRWISSTGINLFCSALSVLTDNTSEAVDGFINYYSFLLMSSEKNIHSLIDLLFTIPMQFIKEFKRD